MASKRKIELRRSEPVPEGDRPERPNKASQSLLAQVENCARAGMLYMKYGGGVQNHAMARGSAFHEFAERATRLMLEQGEVRLPFDLAVTLMEETITDNRDLVFPTSDRRALMSMANNWAKATAIDAEAIKSVERMAEIDIGDWKVRGKIDRLEQVGPAALIVDYKTSLAVPSQEKFDRGFQGPFYALLCLLGVWEDTQEPVFPEGGITEIHFREEYPRYYRAHNNTLATRVTIYKPEDLVEFKLAVEDLLGRLDHGLETGEFPATPGEHCARCPAHQECPIPQQFRDIQSVDDDDEARATWDRATVMATEVSRLKASVREYVKAIERPIPLNKQLELGFTLVESEAVKDKDALRAFIEQTPGGTVDDFYAVRSSTRFGTKKVEAEGE